MKAINVILIRHGRVPGNAEGRYVGSTDESLLPGEAERVRDIWMDLADRNPDYLFVSPLLRTRETASALFPGKTQIVHPGFSECDFGEFEYRNFKDLDGNADYQRFIDSGGTIAFPGGESRAEFARRVTDAFDNAMEHIRMDLTHRGCEDRVHNAVFVVHGGTIMAILDRYSNPHKDYFDWQVKNGCGFACRWAPKEQMLTEINGRIS